MKELNVYQDVKKQQKVARTELLCILNTVPDWQSNSEVIVKIQQLGEILTGSSFLDQDYKKVEINKELYVKYFRYGLSQTEIAKKFSVTNVELCMWRELNNL
ncbi:hypothetical protein [Enterococcus termitis]|uniref:Uncharacterized protein n=1 Tax=Enterococcus termitis TaxID=332950 RepID=A0A1E5GJA4_9ENTE|nr:hypothetical protein [Enterococcus termitis]OEG12767.1 hypothetical protein BCR25_19450 [Enterococcus termitis]OJG95587.1 hypothetical protein RV18_GL002907 [Enterococcus termitis]